MVELVLMDQEVESRMAKERQKAAGDKTTATSRRDSCGRILPKSQLVPDLAQAGNLQSPVKELSRNGKTRDILAEKAGVSHGTFDKARKWPTFHNSIDYRRD
ncbi:MAG: hypothetical protein ACP5VQ_11605 [Phycisphaerae bacterium]